MPKSTWALASERRSASSGAVKAIVSASANAEATAVFVTKSDDACFIAIPTPLYPRTSARYGGNFCKDSAVRVWQEIHDPAVSLPSACGTKDANPGSVLTSV